MRATPEPTWTPSHEGRRTGRQCPCPGKRTHSTRRSYDRPGSPGKPDTGGGGLDIRADQKSLGQHKAVITSLKVEAAKMNIVQPGWNAGCAERCLSGVGGAWGNSTAERQHGRPHSTSYWGQLCLREEIGLLSTRSPVMSHRGSVCKREEKGWSSYALSCPLPWSPRFTGHQRELLAIR